MSHKDKFRRRYSYELWGALVPEWTSITIPIIKARLQKDEFDVEIEIYFHGSNFNVAIFSQKSINKNRYPDIINIIKSIVSNISNYISIQYQGSYHVVFRYFSDSKRKERYVLGVTEPIFDRPQPGFTFTGKFDGIPSVVFQNPFIARALDELSQSVTRQGLTLMHCRIALEACMQNFSTGSKVAAWSALSSALSVKDETIKSFLKISHAQRHGESVSTTWQERKNAMQIAWEIVNRLIVFEMNKISNNANISFQEI